MSTLEISVVEVSTLKWLVMGTCSQKSGIEKTFGDADGARSTGRVLRVVNRGARPMETCWRQGKKGGDQSRDACRDPIENSHFWPVGAIWGGEVEKSDECGERKAKESCSAQM